MPNYYKQGAVDLTSTGGGAGTEKIEIAPIPIPSHPAEETTFTWHEVPDICLRGVMSRLTITASGTGKFDIEVRSEAAGGGELLLAAQNAEVTYDISIPVYVEGDDNSSLWLGIKNTGLESRTYTVTALRVEKFA